MIKTDKLNKFYKSFIFYLMEKSYDPNKIP